MAETRRFGLIPQLDMEQILLDARYRWLRPAEICEILKNHHKFNIAPEPPNKPSSGALFLFDRKVLRYFRKDGHNWRKKKDGKTVKEAHERLKAGSIDVLHCYYAHGEENPNFQRRSYWMLEEDFMHIVLVHYLEVKNKESYSRSRDIEEVTQPVCSECPASNSLEDYNKKTSQATTAESSVQTPECEDAEPDFQASSRYNPITKLVRLNDNTLTDANLPISQLPIQPQNRQGIHHEQRIVVAEPDLSYPNEDVINNYFDGNSTELTFIGCRSQTDLTTLDEVMEYYKEGFDSTSFQPSPATIDLRVVPFVVGEQDSFAARGDPGWQSTDPEGGSFVTYSTDIKKTPVKEGKVKYQSLLKQLSLDLPNTEEDKGLQKHDSFSRWMSNELEEVSDSHMQASSSAIYWDAVDSESVVNSSTMSDQDQMDAYLLSPSVSQDQLFSIDDFSPGWAFSDSGTKVVVSGSFLKNRNDVDKCKWSCMFGEVEVPAEILADGVLQCHAPPRKSGRVPFYITCSNRSACSEVREFEYRDKNDKCLETSEPCSESLNKIMLYIRLEKFLSDGSLCHLEAPVVNNDKSHICKKISLLLMETDDGLPLTSKGMAKKEFYMDRPANDQLRQKQLKEKLRTWLIHKVTEDGKGPNILDNEGQGVIHLAAALGYDWAVAPTIFAGVNINFRDTHGWTALHWAASYGRESTVATLVSFGADSGAVTDPTPEFPSGRTPSDLASKNGHKGIAGFLANSSLTSHLSMLTLKQSGENNISSTSSINNSEDAVEKKVLDHREGDPLKNSLDAVRTAADAAARIHQVFRVQSFQRKEATKYDEISKEHALSLISMKRTRTGHHDEPGHAAAVQIQNRFRGWKGRKEFLIIRQRIVKIQAHVRGHQVRKHFRKFVWTVGIVEKVILRWRRKGTGLRGFRPETSVGTAMQALPAVKEDDYDFLKEGRRQTEAKFDRALARVQSMVQYPDARAQYWRMLNAEKFQESKKAVLENILNDPDVAMDADTMFELEELLGDDTLMHD